MYNIQRNTVFLGLFENSTIRPRVKLGKISEKYGSILLESMGNFSAEAQFAEAHIPGKIGAESSKGRFFKTFFRITRSGLTVSSEQLSCATCYSMYITCSLADEASLRFRLRDLF